MQVLSDLQKLVISFCFHRFIRLLFIFYTNCYELISLGGSSSMMKKQKIRVFEAFAGIGAQSVALRRAGISYENVGISEWFINAILAYDAINCSDEPLPEIPSFEEQIKYLKQFTFSRDSQTPIQDITHLNKKIIQKLYVANIRTHNFGSITDITGEEFPECDLLTYSFPCQDLSTGGKTKGMKKGSGTRSGLLWEIERIVVELKKLNKLPEYLLLENVPTIIAASNKPDLDAWLKELKDLGYYNSEPQILCGSDFGVRQDRRRCIIVSSLHHELKLDKLKTKKLPSIHECFFDDYSNPIYKAEADEASLNPTRSREIMWRINKRDPVTKNTIFHTVTCNLDRSNNAGMVKYDGPKDGKWKRKYRLLTSRECFHLMGFNDEEYKKLQTLGLSYRQRNKLIGNSIIVNVLQAVFEYMLEEYSK